MVASQLAGDAAEVLGHGRFGLLFDGSDGQALADAIAAQLSDRPILPGIRARDYGLTADAYLSLIEDALAYSAATTSISGAITEEQRSPR